MLVPPADILLVDDNPDNLDVLSRVLRKDGHRVRTVTSGSLGLEASRRHLPELVLMDVMMPEMDGYQTCQAMAADPLLKTVPVIFISALEDPLDKVRAFQAGGRDYITKPFSTEEVKTRVEHQVTLARLEKDLSRQNQALMDANLKLKEIHTLKANFTAMLVHDIRSPLTSVGLVLDMLREGVPLKESTVEQAESCFARVHHLLEEMLELHRSEHGNVPLEPEPFDAREWLEALGRHFAVRAERAEIRFQCVVPKELPRLCGDRDKLERVMHNLLDNALKFTPKGGAVSVEASVEYGSGVESGLRFLKLNVVDTGRGISSDLLPFIFDPFRQVERGDAHRGFGLGLAITQRLVAAHRGQIRAQSQVGFGTSFSVLLPL